ncbi:hypothetical protein BJ912DRAFT_1048750 [Pholiota molesta]|nr:hypothetical protein BJ912DRAFT_1048750 [Pholiota molesta]
MAYIFGGTFTNVTSSNRERYGLQILLENIAKGAFHNAAERGDPPRCHPHTRKAIRAEIMEWIKAPKSMRKLILWMYGPAGAGKTAIAQSIAEECEREGLLAASFFFSRTAAGRNDTTRFIATLAYQLSRSVPQIEDNLFTAIEQDPTIFSRSLSTQIRVLVIEPLKAAPSFLRPIFLLVDGIDECGPDFRSQADILNILATAMSELQHIPFIILLASRPEYEIREAFLGNHLRPLVKRLVLDHNYMPDEDIRLFFNDIFQEIHNKHLRLGSRLPSPWPAQSDVDLLVLKASGQFIFAATVTVRVLARWRNAGPTDAKNEVYRCT